MITKKDICLVIPTYNRSDDVNKTLSAIIKNKNIPGKIIIVDQSKDAKTKEVCKKYSSKLPIKYIFSKQPSSSIAENLGVKEGKKQFPLILISGDDIDFLPNYMEELAKEFNEHEEVIGVGGIDTRHVAINYNSFLYKIVSIFPRIFFLPYVKNQKFLIIGPYGHTISLSITKQIRDAQYLPGFNNCFRREVYKDYSFPEIPGYNVLEDIDCSYNVYKKYGKGSLVITPRCRTIHRESQAARYPQIKRIFANHEDHFSFYYRHFHTFNGTLKLMWSLTGIIIGNMGKSIIKPRKENFLRLKYNLEAIYYCIKHKKEIKKGKVRKFLNPDLSMKDEY